MGRVQAAIAAARRSFSKDVSASCDFSKNSNRLTLAVKSGAANDFV